MNPDERLALKRVSADFADAFAVMRDAFMASGEDEWTGGALIAHTDPTGYLETLRSWSDGINLPPTEHLKQFGGNIGYNVHPGYRIRGIATWALRTALEMLAAKGVTKALLTRIIR